MKDLPNHSLPSFLPPLNANANIPNVGSNSRLCRLLALQKGSQPTITAARFSDLRHERQKSREVPEINISKRLTKDELFRVAYMPFVMAQVVWDYADTLCDLSVIARESRLKRLCRAVKGLRREYDRGRAPFIDSAAQAKEEEHMIAFQEAHRDFFAKLRLAVTERIHTSHGVLDPDRETLVAACCMGVLCHRALRKLVAWADALIERKCGRASHSIMPDQMRQLGTLLPEFAGDYGIDLGTPQMDMWRDTLVNHVLSVELIENR